MQRVHDLVIHHATRQVTRDIAHLADIEVETTGPDVAVPADLGGHGFTPITTHVVARSHDLTEASVQTRVTVWELPRTAAADLCIVNAVAGYVPIDRSRLDPAPDEHLCADISGFVARIIAHMVAELNATMTHARSHVSDETTTDDVAEYETN